MDITHCMSRPALLLACSHEEADMIRKQAFVQSRTISAYVFLVVMRSVTFDEKQFAEFGRVAVYSGRLKRGVGPRTTMLLRCTTEQALRIRTAAKRRDVTISGYILYCLKRSWTLAAVNPIASP